MKKDINRPAQGVAALRGGVFAAQEAPGDDGNSTVIIAAWPPEPLNLRQTGEQTVSFRGEVPVCIRVCEPICARSDYQIEITLFDRPVATIKVAGTTRIENCGGSTTPTRF